MKEEKRKTRQKVKSREQKRMKKEEKKKWKSNKPPGLIGSTIMTRKVSSLLIARAILSKMAFAIPFFGCSSSSEALEMKNWFSI
jgi:hypothetical protein